MSGTLPSKSCPSKVSKNRMGQGGFGTPTCPRSVAVIRNTGAETTKTLDTTPLPPTRTRTELIRTKMSVTIREASEAYLNERETELSDSSLQNHRYQIKQFRKWCKDNSIATIDNLEAIDISRFRRDRSQDINNNTLYNQLSVLRLFLAFCARMQWCDEHLSESIVLPRRNGQARHTAIDADRVESILNQLEEYRYASVDHVILALLWTTGVRIGALRSLDIDDVHIDERWIDVRHRPDTETPLKNNTYGHKYLNILGGFIWLRAVRAAVRSSSSVWKSRLPSARLSRLQHSSVGFSSGEPRGR